jgi:hypothetical protein
MPDKTRCVIFTYLGRPVVAPPNFVSPAGTACTAVDQAAGSLRMAVEAAAEAAATTPESLQTLAVPRRT